MFSLLPTMKTLSISHDINNMIRKIYIQFLGGALHYCKTNDAFNNLSFHTLLSLIPPLPSSCLFFRSNFIFLRTSVLAV